MHVCVCLHVPACVCTSAYEHACAHMHLYMNEHACIHASAHACASACVCACSIVNIQNKIIEKVDSERPILDDLQ